MTKAERHLDESIDQTHRASMALLKALGVLSAAFRAQLDALEALRAERAEPEPGRVVTFADERRAWGDHRPERGVRK